MKLLPMITVALLSGIGLIASMPAEASASALLTAPSVKLTVEATGQSSNSLLLRATVAPPVPGKKVTFYLKTSEFEGSGWMALGSSSSDSQGIATYSYRPASTGIETFGSELGSLQSSASTPSATFQFRVLRDPPGFGQSVIEYPRPLGSVGSMLVKGLLSLVGLVWVVLIGSLVMVIRRVPKFASGVQPDQSEGADQ